VAGFGADDTDYVDTIFVVPAWCEQTAKEDQLPTSQLNKSAGGDKGGRTV
jgi:hypothetical protein